MREEKEEIDRKKKKKRKDNRRNKLGSAESLKKKGRDEKNHKEMSKSE